MDFNPSSPSTEEVSLSFKNDGAIIKVWTEYQYAANMELPSDGWSFTVGAEKLPDDVLIHLAAGERVQLKINNLVQGDGYIDSIEVHANRKGGTEYNIQGRDLIAQAVDANADPTVTFKEGMTLLDVLKQLFAPYGWANDDDFLIDNDDNTKAKAGIRGIPHTKGGKKKGPQPLKKFLLHQLRPYPREGVFQFASRICERHGLKIWQAASGGQLVVSRPNFDIDPFYQIRRNREGTTNIIDGSVKFDIKNQPTCIVADGSSGGGEFGRGQIKAIMGNTAVHTTDPAFLTPFQRYPDATRVLGHKFDTPVFVPKARTLYLHDEESTTQFQLNNFCRREMARLQKESLTVSYMVEGHGQIVDGDFVPWTVDTTVDVVDDVAGLRERMYIVARTFHKSRTSGTSTSLALIRLHTIDLGDPDDPAPAPIAKTDADIEKERRYIEYQSAK